MNTSSLYYKHSGRVGFQGPLLMLISALAAAIVLGAVYGYLVWYNPFVYINFFATLGFGGLCGGAVGLAAKQGRVRNDSIVIAFGFAAGLLAVHVGWVFWIHAATDHALFAMTPGQILDVMVGAAHEGVWSMFDVTPTGLALYAIWSIEAIMIVGAAVVGSSAIVGESENTFCDRCNLWLEDVFTSPFLSDIQDPLLFKTQLEELDYKPMVNLVCRETVDVPGQYTRLVVQGCPSCREFFCLDVSQVVLSVGEKGETEEAATLLVDNLIISSSVHEMLVDAYAV